ncbi:hypothetical protein Lalb_Chr18g0048091 [Lupinus albus]|uniref:Uncharacterized protein n=1 Tax=Lupinus albus TaxID=3870 RepID=A0A6A4NT50_LUPAL|nr:hypothetical protein Lalb_Chr18g0048091 [Lupinus albus]
MQTNHRAITLFSILVLLHYQISFNISLIQSLNSLNIQPDLRFIESPSEF